MADTGVYWNFTRTCQECAGTVTVVGGQEQPHDCRAPQVWEAGSEQPGREVDTVRDVDGDVWERWEGDAGEHLDIWSPDGDPDFVIVWGELVKEFGPLIDMTERESSDGR